MHLRFTLSDNQSEDLEWAFRTHSRDLSGTAVENHQHSLKTKQVKDRHHWPSPTYFPPRPRPLPPPATPTNAVSMSSKSGELRREITTENHVRPRQHFPVNEFGKILCSLCMGCPDNCLVSSHFCPSSAQVLLKVIRLACFIFFVSNHEKGRFEEVLLQSSHFVWSVRRRLRVQAGVRPATFNCTFFWWKSTRALSFWLHNSRV